MAVFVHGCFWHRHFPCRATRTPRTNTSLWLARFRQTTARDAEVRQRLIEAGWGVFTAWECELKADANGVAQSVEFYLEKLRVSVS